MKALSFLFWFASALAVVLMGCTDDRIQPVMPSPGPVPSSLAKAEIISYTFTEFPVGVTGEGWYGVVPGGKLDMKQFGVTENLVASDPLVTGQMVHYLSMSIDATTGEGPCHGSFTLTPANNAAEGGVWEGKYEGYRSKATAGNEWTLPLKIIGQGKGGNIDGMQMYSTTTLTITEYGPTVSPQTSSWVGAGEGYYKAH